MIAAMATTSSAINRIGKMLFPGIRLLHTTRSSSAVTVTVTNVSQNPAEIVLFSVNGSDSFGG